MQLRITTAGRDALLNADNTGTKAVRIAQIGLTKTSFTAKADGSDTVLPGEFKRLTTFAGKATSADTIHVTVRDETADVYQLRGMALYLDNGVLFGLYGQAAVILEKAGPAMMLLAADVKFTTVNATQITFGNADFLNPNATTETYGVVELATLTEAEGGTDEVRAVTPRGLKAYIDKRFGTTAPTTFVRNLLALTTSATFRAALEIKGAALKDEGAGNGLDADTVDGKHAADFANASHTHTIANVNGLQAALDSKAPGTHTHAIAQVTGLTAALDAKVGNQGLLTDKTYDEHFAQGGAAAAYHSGSQAPTDAPVGAQQHSVLHLGNQWGRTQLAFPNNAQRMFFRSGVSKGWAEAWHSLNFDPASKASIAGANFTGNIAAPQVKASGGHFIGNTSYTLIAPAGAPANGVIYLRPGGDADRTAELRVEAGGITFANKETVWHSGIFKPADKADLAGANTWTSRQTFNGGVSLANDRLTDIGTGGATLRGTSEGSVVLASGGKETGHVYLRPNGNTDTAGQVVVYGSGVLAASSAKFTASGDGAVMLDLAGERSWQFRQSGAAGNAALELFDATGGKEFRLTSTANGNKIAFNPTGSWIAATEFRGALAGNAATASKLFAPRLINGTNFDGATGITTATWGAPRNIQIGAATKSVNGGGNVTWTLSEMGAASLGDLSTKIGYTSPTNNDDTWLESYDTYRINRQTTVGSTTMPAQYTMAINFPSYDGSRGLAMAFDYGGGNRFWMRSRRDTGGTLPGDRWKDWIELYHSGNFNPASKANVSHTHAISEVAGLQGELNAKANLSGASFTGQVEVAGTLLGGAGCVRMNAGDSGRAGYLAMHTIDGTRRGYIGWNDGANRLQYQVESGFTGHSFTGNVIATGGFDVGSSRKLKEIQGVAPYGLAEVEQMETAIGIYHSDYNSDGRRRLFFVAEQLANLVPESVDADGVFYNGELVPSVKTEQLLPVFANAIRELSHRLREVEARR